MAPAGLPQATQSLATTPTSASNSNPQSLLQSILGLSNSVEKLDQLAPLVQNLVQTQDTHTETLRQLQEDFRAFPNTLANVLASSGGERQRVTVSKGGNQEAEDGSGNSPEDERVAQNPNWRKPIPSWLRVGDF